MITNTDINAIKLSPTKKDFYQIWNELLDTAKALSDRWDPTATNESDPGIVLLKVVTAIADKLNYNIDKNILEDFMPSAAQMESMRKLCEMMGYNIKYYQSAVINVKFSYISREKDLETSLNIPQFTSVYDADKTINYVTMESTTVTPELGYASVPCIEGQIVQCETDNDNVVSMAQIDDANRYYLPETQVAENGIFIYNVKDGILSERWEKVENLNIQQPKQLVYKFGFDSRLGRPYIQFPEDIAHIIEDGLIIYFIRTSGVNGNISANKLSSFDKPGGDEWADYETSDFIVTNAQSAIGGRNVETITEAYEGFKKTIGTFDTLVTCRDYMNKIYQLTYENGQPYVSNIIVSDIRDDINNATTICSFNDYGLSYVEKSDKITIGGAAEDKIDHFDIIFYPFKTIYNINSRQDYLDSFTYSSENFIDIRSALDKNKTISHNIRLPEFKNDDGTIINDIVCIKNYVRLKVILTTTYKVNRAEETLILANVKEALYKNFNMRKLDFGEELVLDNIIDVIENADSRIKKALLDSEPVLFTKILCADGNEYSRVDAAESTDLDTKSQAIKLFNRMTLRNILAGRVPLFNYNNSFTPSFTEKAYTYGADEYESVYPTPTDLADDILIKNIKPSCTITFENPGTPDVNVNLTDNEKIVFRAPNYKTTTTYPAYVNYYIKLKNKGIAANPAVMITLADFIRDKGSAFVAQLTDSITKVVPINNNWDTIRNIYGEIYKKENDAYVIAAEWESGEVYYVVNVIDTTFNSIVTAIQNIDDDIQGLYRRLNSNPIYIPGYMIDQLCYKYDKISGGAYVGTTGQTPDKLFVPDTSKANYGLGVDHTPGGIKNDEIYQLKDGEFLCINYSKKASDTGSQDTTPINKVYSTGTIIRVKMDSKLLEDSDEASKTHSWSKKTGFDFSGSERPSGGMFTLNASEQIEIIEPVEVELKPDRANSYAVYNLYLVVKDRNMDHIEENKPYTLKENEYLFYTDNKKLDFAWVTTGTEITVNGNIVLNAANFEEITDIDALVNDGIDAIPWVPFNTTDDNYLTFKEYQYLSLTSGDQLCTIEFKTANTDDSEDTNEDNTGIDETPRKVASATYIFDYKDKSGDELIPESLPALTIPGVYWEVTSGLDLNIGPATRQVLLTEETTNYTKVDKVTLAFTDDEKEPVELESQKDNDKYIPLSLNMNVDLQTSLSNIAVNTTDYKPIQVKLFEYEDIQMTQNGTAVSNTVNLHNLNKLWTTVSPADLANGKTLTLHFNIPDNTFGLWMIYQGGITNTTVAGKTGGYLTTTATDLAIYNYSDPSSNSSNWSWWKGLKAGSNYYLVNNINVILIKESCDIIIHPDNNGDSPTAAFIFGDLSLVNIENANNIENGDGINQELLQYIADTPEKQLLDDIKEVCHPDDSDNTSNAENSTLFYYNCPMDKSIAIDVNELLVNEENMANPRIWYNYNNINNKFVISELDAEWIDENNGIRIAQSSKL